MNFSQETVFRGDRFNIQRIRQTGRDGREHSRDIVRHPGAVVLLPITQDDRVVLIRNYRVSVDQTLIELPAGTIEEDEPAEKTAARELIEETGYRAGRVELLRKFYSTPGICDETMYLFAAHDLVAGDPQREAGEEIENLLATWDEIRAWIDDGSIQDAKTLVGLLSYGGSR